MVVSNEVFYRSYDAIGSGLVIFAQPTKHAGRVGYSRIANAILDLMPGGISPLTLLASRPEIFLGIQRVSMLGENAYHVSGSYSPEKSALSQSAASRTCFVPSSGSER